MTSTAVDIDKRLTWDEMVEKYPDMWVVVKDAEMDGPDVLSGTLVAVKADDEIDSFQIQTKGRGYKYRRTTEGFWNGITGSSIVISVG